MGKTRNTTDREWACRIVALRRRLGISQSELGKQLNSSAMAVSRWERGVQEPPANIYIQLGNITGDPECWYFWGQAGLQSADVMRVNGFMNLAPKPLIQFVRPDALTCPPLRP